MSLGLGFRIANERGSLGISCKESGLALAGVPLLRQTDDGFEPRPSLEIEVLIDRAYLGGIDGTRIIFGISVVARALNDGNMAKAMIASVMLRLPELDWDAAICIANADDMLLKYPGQPRGWHQYYGPGKESQPEKPDAVSVEDAAYQGTYHDTVVAGLAAVARADGSRVITEVNLVGVNGVGARADLLIIPPAGEPLILLEIKTGDDPTFTDGQRVIYPMAQIGGHVYSPDPKIRELGFAPGELLPPMEFWTVYKKDEKSPFMWFPNGDPILP